MNSIKTLKMQIQESQSQQLAQLSRLNTNQKTQFQQSKQNNNQNNQQTVSSKQKQKQQLQKTQQRLQQQRKQYFGHLNLLYMYLQNTTFYQQLKMRYTCLSSLSNQQKRNLVATGQVVRMSQVNKLVQLQVKTKKIMLIIHGDVQYLGMKYTKGQCMYSHPETPQCNTKINCSYKGGNFQSSASLQKSTLLQKNLSESQKKDFTLSSFLNALTTINPKQAKLESSNKQQGVGSSNSNLRSTFRFIEEDKEQIIRVNPERQLEHSQKDSNQILNIQIQSENQDQKIISFGIINKTSLLALDRKQFEFYLKLFQEQYDKKCLLQKIINPLKAQGRSQGSKINITSQVIKKLGYKMKIFQTKDPRTIINPDYHAQYEVHNTIKEVFGFHLNTLNNQKKTTYYRPKFRCMLFLIQGVYTVLNKQGQEIAEIENTYAGQQILWSDQYQYKIKVKSIYAKYGTISKQQFLLCVGTQVIDYLKTTFNRRKIQRNRVQNKLNLVSEKIKQNNKAVLFGQKNVKSKGIIHQKQILDLKLKKPKNKLTKGEVMKLNKNYTASELESIKSIVQYKVKQFQKQELDYTPQKFQILRRSRDEKRKGWNTIRAKTQTSNYSQQKILDKKFNSPSPKHQRSKTLSYFQTPQKKIQKQFEKIQTSKKAIFASAIQLSNSRRYNMQKTKSNITLKTVDIFDFSREIMISRTKTFYQIKKDHPKDGGALMNLKRLFKMHQINGGLNRPYSFR